MTTHNYLTTDSLDLLAFIHGHSAWAELATQVLRHFPSGAHPAIFKTLVLKSIQPVLL
jgi:hypothetical protein